MIGEPEKDNLCPLCGGRLKPGLATIPFIFAETVIVVKDVPAEICGACREPFTGGAVTGHLTDLLSNLRQLKAEVSIISYNDIARVSA